MRILLIHSPYRGGGGENLSVQDFYESAAEHGVDVHRFEARPILSSKSNPLNLLLELKTIISRAKPDLAVVYNLFPALAPVVLPVLRETRTPWIHFLRNYRKKCIAATEFRAGRYCDLCTTAPGGRLHSLANRCYRGSSALTSVAQISSSVEATLSAKYPPVGYAVFSEHMENALRDSLPRQSEIFLLPNLVRRPDVDEPKLKRNVVHFSGRWVTEKGSEFLQKVALLAPEISFEAFTPEIPHAFEGNVWPRNISFQAGKSREESLGAMASSRVSCVPSQYFDPSPRTVFESLSLGVPVVSSEEADSAGVLSLPESGSYVLESDPEVWASVLGSFTSSAQDGPHVSASSKAKRYFNDNLSPEAVFPRYRKLFESIY